MTQVLRTLIVDDSEADALQLSYLIEQDYLSVAKCEVASTRKAALEWLNPERHQPFEGIIADLNLPDSEGLETFRSLRAAAPQAAIIVLSGRGDTRQLRDLIIEEGAGGYLEKGKVSPKQIFETLRDAIELQRTTARLTVGEKLVLDESERRASAYVAEARRNEGADHMMVLQAETLQAMLKSNHGLHSSVAKLAEKLGELQGQMRGAGDFMREFKDRLDETEATGRHTQLDLATTKKDVETNAKRIGAIFSLVGTILGYAFAEREAILEFLRSILG